jgi:3',5'-cyclic AMP phosphodiesterase CpdA
VFRFAHISDIHLDLSQHAIARARLVMAYLRGLPLDAIVITGDITDHGTAQEYELAKAELAADVPVLMLPGNHDERVAFRKVLLDADSEQPINEVRLIGRTTFALCDSSIPGSPEGLLAEETVKWLDSVLAEGDGPVFVCLHHPPVKLHSELIDKLRLTEPERFAALIDRYPRVVAILCGHAHAAAASTFAGRPLLIAPGVASRLRLPWATTEHLTWHNTLDFSSPPAAAFHILDNDNRLTTHYLPVPQELQP